MDPEKVAYWYLHLNGFLQMEDFYVHPSRRGSALTDADLLAVRFPYRAFVAEHYGTISPPLNDPVRLVPASPPAQQRCVYNGGHVLPPEVEVKCTVGTCPKHIYTKSKLLQGFTCMN